MGFVCGPKMCPLSPSCRWGPHSTANHRPKADGLRESSQIQTHGCSAAGSPSHGTREPVLPGGGCLRKGARRGPAPPSETEPLAGLSLGSHSLRREPASLCLSSRGVPLRTFNPVRLGRWPNGMMSPSARDAPWKWSRGSSKVDEGVRPLTLSLLSHRTYWVWGPRGGAREPLGSLVRTISPHPHLRPLVCPSL